MPSQDCQESAPGTIEARIGPGPTFADGIMLGESRARFREPSAYRSTTPRGVSARPPWVSRIQYIPAGARALSDPLRVAPRRAGRQVALSDAAPGHIYELELPSAVLGNSKLTARPAPRACRSRLVRLARDSQKSANPN